MVDETPQNESGRGGEVNEAPKKGIGKRLVGYWAMPVTRPLADVRASTARIRDRLKEIKELKDIKAQRMAELEKYPDQDRFEKLYRENDWSEDELAKQITAVRRAKWAGLVAVLIWFALMIAAIVLSGGFFSLILAVALIGSTMFGALQVFRMALFETQLKLRSLIKAKDFLSRDDFIRRVLS